MTDSAVLHDTLTFERQFASGRRLLWDAFVDPSARETWGTPSPDAVVEYLETDFRVGGRDVSRCGSKQDPRFRVEAIYLDILEERRIVYCEKIADRDTPLSAALHTVEFHETPAGCSVRIAVQVASYAGEGMVDGVRQGMTAALDHLGDMF